MHGEDEDRHGDQVAQVGIAPNRLFERHDLAEVVDGGEIANLKFTHASSDGKSVSVVMTGRPGGKSAGSSPDRRSRTARMPAASAPSMSCARLSPTITAWPAGTPAFDSAVWKMLRCGFM